MPAIIIALVVLLGGSAVTAVAADSARPGDLLFPIDIAVENARLAMASEDGEVELRLAFSRERLEEVEEILTEAKERKDKRDQNRNTDKSNNGANPNNSDDDADDDTGMSAEDVAEEDEDMADVTGALVTALEHLTENRNKLEERGNTQAVAALDSVIVQLGEHQRGLSAEARARVEAAKQERGERGAGRNRGGDNADDGETDDDSGEGDDAEQDDE